jgi:hypothetical protein
VNISIYPQAIATMKLNASNGFRSFYQKYLKNHVYIACITCE